MSEPGHARNVEVENIFREYYPKMCALAKLMTGDSAAGEDMAMEAFVRAFARWRTISMYDDPRAYVRKVVVNLCRSRWRRIQVENRSQPKLLAPELTSEDHSDRESGYEVREAVVRLPFRQRACVVLRYFDDMSEAGIAETLGCSIGTVKSQLAKARKHLALMLGSDAGTLHV